MSRSNAARAIVVNDARRLMRDRFLLGASAYILAVALALRWLVPWLRAELLASNGFDITPFVPLGVSYFAVVNASVLTGMVGGFLLLESREERTIKAMLITPTPLSLPLGLLAAAVFLTGALTTIALAAAIGVGVPDAPALVASALVGAPMGIVMTLILATVASNKVEAFAVMKITGFLGLIPIGAYFLPEPLQFLAGLVPVYWACKIWWTASAGDPGWTWMVLPGLLVSAAWILPLLRRFRDAAKL